MGGSARPFICLTFAWAFSSCFAEVALGVEPSPETTSFHHAATSAPPLSLYQSSSYQGTTVPFNSTSSLETTPESNGTAVQTTAPAHHLSENSTAQATGQTSPAGASTPSANSTASQATTQAMGTVTAAEKNTTIPPGSSTEQTRTYVSTEMTAASTNATINHTTSNTQMTAAATTTTATTTPTVKSTTGAGNQTTAPKSPTTTTMTNTTTVHSGTQTAAPSTTTAARSTPAPQPSAIPTGTYTVSSGNGTCIKAVMGLQLMAQNPPEKRMEYLAVNPNATQTSGSCGTAQAELNITFSRGFINFTFVKQPPTYYVSKIESGLQSFSGGMLYYAAIRDKLFTTKLGNSFKCVSKQIFVLEKHFQLLFVNMQLQAFDIVGNQFGKEEECFPDKNSRAAPIAVGLSILGLFVIVFVTFLISRRKPHRGYERI